jgi:hypothetical protein
VRAAWEPAALSFDEAGDKANPAKIVTLVRGKGERKIKVSVAVRLPHERDFGLHQGELTLETSDKNYPRLAVPIVYNLVPEYSASLNKVSFGLVRSGRPVRRDLVLCRPDGRAIGEAAFAVEVSADNGVQPLARVTPGGGGKAGLELTLSAPPGRKQGLYRGDIRIRAGDQPVLSIPWVCVIKG